MTEAASSALPFPVPPGVDELALSQVLIPATDSLVERPRATLKDGDIFGVFDKNGDAITSQGSPEGLFYRDTRYLSHLHLTIDGARPMMLSSTLRDDNAALTSDLTNPDIFDEDGRLLIEHDRIHLRRTRFLRNSGCYERLLVRNFDSRRRTIRLGIVFAADFADLFEVRGMRREARGELHPPEINGNSVLLAYTGLDRQRRTTRLTFDPAPDSLNGHAAILSVTLEPGESRSLFLQIACDAEEAKEAGRLVFLRSLRETSRALRNVTSQAASVATSNEIFNEVVRRSVADLYMLITETEYGPYPYAGIPWFSTAFGRDALITALQTLWFDPSIARGVLNYLAACQATELDPLADAEPGKILHEARHGEMAILREVPFGQYYGSIDSTPLFVMLAGAYLDRTGDIETIRGIWPNIEAALGWIEQHGDSDGDGFVEYGRKTSEGLINQGWKDSHDSVFHADGTQARGPIALVEVQAYVYGAWQAAGKIAAMLGDVERSVSYVQKAKALRKAFDASFFDEEMGTYVLALDGDKRPCRVHTSNAGHTLLTGIAYRARAESVVRHLMSPNSFSGWGVRTVASFEARYNPMSYHNGSVWPHDNALIAVGFSRYGFRRQAARIFEGLFATATYIELRRLPELYCGFPRRRTRGPTLYPVACSPQAWAATAPLAMLQAALGLNFDTEQLYVSFEQPALPEFLDEVTFRNLSVGEGSIDVSLRRSGSRVAVDVLECGDAIRVLTTN